MPKQKWFFPVHLLIVFVLLFHLPGIPAQQGAYAQAEAGPVLPYPILFVTQLPLSSDFTSIASVFGNHKPGLQDVGRGGDLWIRYPDGTLKNLTQTAGYGITGFQNHNAIAVRDPSVDWDGSKALFS